MRWEKVGLRSVEYSALNYVEVGRMMNIANVTGAIKW